jgi:hypothetical protein
MDKRFENPLSKTIEGEPEQEDRDILGNPKVFPSGSAAHKSTSSVNSLEEIGADNFRGAAETNIGDDNLRGKNPNKEED